MNGDTLKYVLRYTECGTDYKSFCLVAKEWFKVLREMFDRGDVFANHLLTLLKLFPDAKWNYVDLSGNPNMRMWYVLENSEKEDWYSHGLSANSGIQPDEIVNTKY
jgi:hypothetical protein